MKKILVTLMLGWGLAGAVYAQQPAAPQLPPKLIEYFDKDRQKLPSAENAYYRVETTFRDNQGMTGTKREYYPGGQVKSITHYADLKKQMEHGTATTWYEDGKQHTKEDYFAGQREGELLVYYPDGTVRRRDQFLAGKRTAGECFGSDGKPVEYFEYEVMPAYPGGMDAMLNGIARSVRYPVDALRGQVQGKVFVAFIVGEDGQVRNVHVTKGLLLSMDTESVRVISQLARFSPGLLDGKPVPVSFTVPITFAMN